MNSTEFLEKMDVFLGTGLSHEGKSEEKRAALNRFLQNSMNRLRKLALEYKSRFFLGFVFEELVRSETSYWLDTDIEKKAERFIFQCLENQDNLGILRTGLWHIPDALGFSAKGGKLCIKRIIEAKTSPYLIDIQQIRGHILDVQRVVESITSRTDRIALDDFFSGFKLAISDNLEKIVVIPAGSKVVNEKVRILESEDWQLATSIFSLDETIFITKELFPEAGTQWLEFKGKKESTPLAGQIEGPSDEDRYIFSGLMDPSLKSLNGIIGFYSSLLSQIYASLGKTIKREELMEAALIWVCTDRILLRPETARDMFSLEDINESGEVENFDLSDRFRRLLLSLKRYFVNDKDATRVIMRLYDIYLEIREEVDEINPELVTVEDALQFI